MPAVWRGWPSRLARANAAVEVLVDGAERYLALTGRGHAHHPHGRDFDAEAIRRAAGGNPPSALDARDRPVGHEGPAELGKVEALLAALDRSFADSRPRQSRASARLKQTLAGALVSLLDGRIRIEPAPARRRKASG